jgi:hypothetical protein
VKIKSDFAAAGRVDRAGSVRRDGRISVDVDFAF